MSPSLPPPILGDPGTVQEIGQAWNAASQGVGSLGEWFSAANPEPYFQGIGSQALQRLLGDHFRANLSRAEQILGQAAGYALNFGGLLETYKAADANLRQQVSDAQDAQAGQENQRSSTQQSISETQNKLSAATDPATKNQHASLLSKLGGDLRQIEGEIARIADEIVSLIEQAITNYEHYLDDVTRHSGLIRDLTEALPGIFIGMGAVAKALEGAGTLGIGAFDALWGAGSEDVEDALREGPIQALFEAAGNDVVNSVMDIAGDGIGILGATGKLITSLTASGLDDAPDWLRQATGGFTSFADSDGLGFVGDGLSVAGGVLDGFGQYSLVEGGTVLKLGAGLTSGMANVAINLDPYTAGANLISGGAVGDDLNGLIGMGAGFLHGGVGGALNAIDAEDAAMTSDTLANKLNVAYWLNGPVNWWVDEAYNPTNAPMRAIDGGMNWLVANGTSAAQTVGKVGGDVANAVGSAASTVGHVAGDGVHDVSDALSSGVNDIGRLF